MTYSTFQYKYEDLDIDLTKIEKVLGYGEGEDRMIVNEIIEGILKEPAVIQQHQG